MVERSLCDGGEEIGAIRSVREALQARRHRDEFGAPNANPEKFEKNEIYGDRDQTIDSSKLTRDTKIPGSRFSVFKWFKKAPRESAKKYDSEKCSEISDLDEPRSELSSNESVSTLYSTATVRSFAFSSGTLNENERQAEPYEYRFGAPNGHRFVDVGPFGAGASKITSLDATKTLPANILSNRRDLTARYSLQSYGPTGAFGSCGNFGVPGISEKRRPLENRTRARVHVRGKRRAPNPPIEIRTKKNQDEKGRRTNRQKRRAPKPPNSAPGSSAQNSTQSNKNIVPKNPFDEEGIENEFVAQEFEINSKTEQKIETAQKCDEQPQSPVVSVTSIKNVQNEKSDAWSGNVDLSRPIDSGKGMNVAENKSESKEINRTTELENGKNEQRACADLTKNKEVDNFPGAISNDSLILQDGVLYSRRDFAPPQTLRSSSKKISNDPLTSNTTLDDPLTFKTTLNDPSSLKTTSSDPLNSKPISDDPFSLKATLDSRFAFKTSLDAEGSLSRSQGRASVTTGSQTSVSAMPRPWYKRSVFENSRESPGTKRGDVLRNPPDIRDDPASDLTTKFRGEKNSETGTLSRLHFFLRNEKSDKKDAKRKSGISILTNISELDKEAAAIVQEEQMRSKSMFLTSVAQVNGEGQGQKSEENAEAVVQVIVNSAMESSPRKGTRALISKFNAISNITKVTVNSNFFAKNCPRDTRSEISEISKKETEEKSTHFKSANVRTDKDLSRYFLPAQNVSKVERKYEYSEKKAEENSPKSSNSPKFCRDYGKRIDDEHSSPDKKNSQMRQSSVNDVKIRKDDDIFEKNLSKENSPKFSRLQINVFDHIQKSKSPSEPTKEIRIQEIGRKSELVGQKESSTVFSRASIFENRTKTRDINETSTSSQVRKVLDILVEAEKNERQRNLSESGKSSEKLPKMELGKSPGKSENVEFGKFLEKPGNFTEKSPISERKVQMNVENLPVTDIREMLKEMKHSLPKRPKVKKVDGISSKKEEKTIESDKKSIVSMNDRRRDFFSTSTEKSALLSPVTVSYPPPIRISQPAEEPGKLLFRSPQNLDYERQKVSSSAQTSGNLRKISNSEHSREKSQWNNGNVIYRTNGKSGTSGLRKNTFQLIRPREFAEIEAVRTITNSATYANVIEDSLYANVPGSSKQCSETYLKNLSEPKFPDEKRSQNQKDVDSVRKFATDRKSYCQDQTKVESTSKFSEETRPLEESQMKVDFGPSTSKDKRLYDQRRTGVEFGLEFSEDKKSCPQGQSKVEIASKLTEDEKLRDQGQKKVKSELKFLEDEKSRDQSEMKIGPEREFFEDKGTHEQGQTKVTSADSKIVEEQNMNTLAVNRLLRNLEAAIASGHHQQAAGLAKELARLKIHCSVVRQRTKARDVVNVNMYIEDKLAHQGPIPLRLARSMSVAQLKTKVFTEFEIPTNVQRWIVGKNLADNDTTTLEELNTVEGSSIFLYLVAPDTKPDAASQKDGQTIEEEIPKNEPDQKDKAPDTTNSEEPELPGELPVEDQMIKEEEEGECIPEEARMERYEALISLENCDVIPNSEAIECPICFVTYGPQEGVILRDCLHMFCRPCIANTIRYCEEAEVKCPYRDTEYTCESTLQEREIKALVEPEVYQQHLAKSIAQAENNAGNNAFHCKTPDCPGWCIYDDNVNNFLCPVCRANNCLTCQVVHAGKNCRQYQEELRFSKETDQESKRTAAMLEKLVDRGEAMPCPTCAVVLMKKWGCDWLRCSMCKTEICWVTRGPRWGPGGKGDTSGGCRCGEKGVKCHPRCNYCH